MSEWTTISIKKEHSEFIEKSKAILGIKSTPDFIDLIKPYIREKIEKMTYDDFVKSVEMQKQDQGIWRIKILKEFIKVCILNKDEKKKLNELCNKRLAVKIYG